MVRHCVRRDTSALEMCQKTGLHELMTEVTTVCISIPLRREARNSYALRGMRMGLLLSF